MPASKLYVPRGTFGKIKSVVALFLAKPR